MRFFERSRALVLSTAVALAPSLAFAQAAAPTEAPVVDAARARARERFMRGLELIRAGRWSEAIAELEAAREIRATPPVFFNLAIAQRAVGKHRAAVRSLREFLQRVSQGADPTVVGQAEEALRDSLAAVVRIELSVEPAEATVRIDGDVTTERGMIELDPGRHVLAIEATGYANYSRTVELVRGSFTLVTPRLVRANEVAFLHVECTTPEALVRIDGREVGHGIVDEHIRAGRHIIDVIGPHHAPFQRELVAVVGSRNNVRVVLTDRRTVFESPVFWAVTGAAVVAGIVTAIILWPAPDPFPGTWDTVDVMGRGQ